MQLGVLGLGANLGDRLANLRAAVAALSEVAELRITGRSSVYETPPAGGPPQPDYLNAAIALETNRSPPELLEQVLTIEQNLGRQRPDAVRWGPRPIDIDILWLARDTCDSPGLKVPHPRLTARPFALVPLLELVPDAVDPTTGRRYDSLTAAQLPLQRIATL
ncbi:MAG: 2-amino-4-hydroxy-6-hydroxymethyldihydropteridine diphosphokinase [Deltaproteobacteria bacterium]|nr:2-amino-4-hydroxy-6-hydroxymethyldihydropteridine diphosphokinase [Deltaproteobacteria bacterium]